MSRIELRIEDICVGLLAIALAATAGWPALISGLRPDDQSLWTISFLLLPIGLLIFGFSVRYAFGPGTSDRTRNLRRIWEVIRDWSPFLFVLTAYSALNAHIGLIANRPDQDQILRKIDKIFFSETPSAWFQSITTPALTNFFAITYLLHLATPPVVAICLYSRDRRVFREFLLSVLVANAIGVFGYALVPAVGPAVAFPDIFSVPLSGAMNDLLNRTMEVARTPRDVFPSLHVGISTVVLWYGWKRSRTLALILIPFTLGNWISTLYLRYHYFIDIVAGWVTALMAILIGRALLTAESKFRSRRQASKLSA